MADNLKARFYFLNLQRIFLFEKCACLFYAFLLEGCCNFWNFSYFEEKLSLIVSLELFFCKNCKFCDETFTFSLLFLELMIERSHSNVTFVTKNN